jgi:hypothetical protein
MHVLPQDHSQWGKGADVKSILEKMASSTIGVAKKFLSVASFAWDYREIRDGRC